MLIVFLVINVKVYYAMLFIRPPPQHWRGRCVLSTLNGVRNANVQANRPIVHLPRVPAAFALPFFRRELWVLMSTSIEID